MGRLQKHRRSAGAAAGRRGAGWVTEYPASGAHVLLSPELPFNLDLKLADVVYDLETKK